MEGGHSPVGVLVEVVLSTRILPHPTTPSLLLCPAAKGRVLGKLLEGVIEGVLVGVFKEGLVGVFEGVLESY